MGKVIYWTDKIIELINENRECFNAEYEEHALENAHYLLQRYIEDFRNQPKAYDKNYGDQKLCKCEHPYYRHFDTYDNMAPIGCKYCDCYKFEPEDE